MANLIDGKAVSAKVKAAVKAETEELKAKGISVGLAVVIVGDNPASRVYVNNKKKACAQAGIYSEEFALPADTTQSAFLSRTSSMAFTREESFFLRMAKVGCSSQDIISGA